MIEVTGIQNNTFCIIIYGEKCVFIPMSLFLEDRFLPLAPKVKGSTLGWYVKRKFISYNQIKAAIKDYCIRVRRNERLTEIQKHD